MPEAWETLTVRGLAATDEHVGKLVGSLIIHREGNPEPVESATVANMRTVLPQLHENLGRLLARSPGIKRRTS